MWPLVTNVFARLLPVRRSSPTAPIEAAADELPASRISRLTYAVGDIHGRYDLFQKMVQRLEADAQASGERPMIVFLGDYIDRGAASRQVLEGLIALTQSSWCDVTVLMGNHEEFLLKFLADPENGPVWVEFGGGATLASYGVLAPNARAELAQWEQVRDSLAEKLPEAHLNFIRQMGPYYLADDYFFVHAGVSPDLPLEAQGPETFLWIRNAFLNEDKVCDYVVVHGHTPQAAPVDKRWRIGLDTGGYATGILTAVRLEGRERLIIQIS